MSYGSKEVLKRTTNQLNKIRRVAELFNRCLEACEEANEKRIAIVDFLDPVTVLLSDYIDFLHECEEGLFSHPFCSLDNPVSHRINC